MQHMHKTTSMVLLFVHHISNRLHQTPGVSVGMRACLSYSAGRARTPAEVWRVDWVLHTLPGRSPDCHTAATTGDHTSVTHMTTEEESRDLIDVDIFRCLQKLFNMLSHQKQQYNCTQIRYSNPTSITPHRLRGSERLKIIYGSLLVMNQTFDIPGWAWTTNAYRLSADHADRWGHNLSDLTTWVCTLFTHTHTHKQARASLPWNHWLRASGWASNRDTCWCLRFGHLEY